MRCAMVSQTPGAQRETGLQAASGRLCPVSVSAFLHMTPSAGPFRASSLQPFFSPNPPCSNSHSRIPGFPDSQKTLEVILETSRLHRTPAPSARTSLSFPY